MSRNMPVSGAIIQQCLMLTGQLSNLATHKHCGVRPRGAFSCITLAQAGTRVEPMTRVRECNIVI